MKRRRQHRSPARGIGEMDRERHRIAWNYAPHAGEPKPLGEILPGVIKDLGIEEQVWQHDLLEAWPAIVGQDLAARTRPGPTHGSTLVVFVTNSVWLNELARYGKRQMLHRIQQRFGGTRIRSLRLQLDPDL